MNEVDLAELGLAHGYPVWVETALLSGGPRRLELTAIALDIARGSVATYYSEANVLMPLGYHDKESCTPSYKSVPVRIRRKGAP
jgi:anaerobic selenocysteine-containing dehydrogenase